MDCSEKTCSVPPSLTIKSDVATGGIMFQMITESSANQMVFSYDDALGISQCIVGEVALAKEQTLAIQEEQARLAMESAKEVDASEATE